MTEEIHNCWEFWECPEKRMQACAAYLEDAGDSCWLISGTLCRGDASPKTFIDKVDDCKKCAWRQQVVQGKIN